MSFTLLIPLSSLSDKSCLTHPALFVTSESSEHEDKSTDASGDIAPQSNPAEVPIEVPKDEVQSLKMTIPKPEENDELGPLPDNWEMAYTEKGEVYFIE